MEKIRGNLRYDTERAIPIGSPEHDSNFTLRSLAKAREITETVGAVEPCLTK